MRSAGTAGETRGVQASREVDQRTIVAVDTFHDDEPAVERLAHRGVLALHLLEHSLEIRDVVVLEPPDLGPTRHVVEGGRGEVGVCVSAAAGSGAESSLQAVGAVRKSRRTRADASARASLRESETPFCTAKLTPSSTTRRSPRLLNAGSDDAIVSMSYEKMITSSVPMWRARASSSWTWTSAGSERGGTGGGLRAGGRRGYSHGGSRGSRMGGRAAWRADCAVEPPRAARADAVLLDRAAAGVLRRVGAGELSAVQALGAAEEIEADSERSEDFAPPRRGGPRGRGSSERPG